MSWSYGMTALGMSGYGCLLVILKALHDAMQERQKGKLIEQRNLYRKHLEGKRLEEDVQAELLRLKEEYGKLRDGWHRVAAASLAVAMGAPVLVWVLFTHAWWDGAGLLLAVVWPWVLFSPAYNRLTGRDWHYRSKRGTDAMITRCLVWLRNRIERTN